MQFVFPDFLVAFLLRSRLFPSAIEVTFYVYVCSVAPVAEEIVAPAEEVAAKESPVKKVVEAVVEEQEEEEEDEEEADESTETNGGTKEETNGNSEESNGKTAPETNGHAAEEESNGHSESDAGELLKLLFSIEPRLNLFIRTGLKVDRLKESTY